MIIFFLNLYVCSWVHEHHVMELETCGVLFKVDARSLNLTVLNIEFKIENIINQMMMTFYTWECM